MKQLPHVIVTGSLGFDYIMNFSGKFADRIMPDKIHAISLSFLVDRLEKQFGGTAGNIAYSLKLLGIEPIIAAPAGKDFQEYIEFLASKNISAKEIPIIVDEMTSSYFVVTDQEDNQIGSFFLGATKYAKDIDLTAIANADDFVMLAPTEPEAMKKYVEVCTKKKLRYMYDPAFQIGNFSSDDLQEGISNAEILIGNDYEISLIEKKIELSHEELLKKVNIVITTLGSKGAWIETQEERIEISPAKPQNVSDPTGAGDAFRGGFLAGYLRGFDLKTCGQMGAVAAVYTVEKYGTVTHTFVIPEFEERYRENFKVQLTLE